jgi:DNA gyrase/topoisomerase IV subunit B
VHAGDLAFDVALQWHWGHEIKGPLMLSWANTVRTSEGSHVLGVTDAIKEAGLHDVPHIVMLSVFVPQPRFTTPTKGCLRNPEIRVLLRDHLTPALRRLADDDEFALRIDWMRTRRGQEDWKRGERERAEKKKAQEKEAE